MLTLIHGSAPIASHRRRYLVGADSSSSSSRSRSFSLNVTGRTPVPRCRRASGTCRRSSRPATAAPGAAARAARRARLPIPAVCGTVESGPTQMPSSMQAPRNSMNCPCRAGLIRATVAAGSMCKDMVGAFRERDVCGRSSANFRMERICRVKTRATTTSAIANGNTNAYDPAGRSRRRRGPCDVRSCPRPGRRPARRRPTPPVTSWRWSRPTPRSTHPLAFDREACATPRYHVPERYKVRKLVRQTDPQRRGAGHRARGQ